MDRIIDVILICLPVFAVVGLGKVLQLRSIIEERDRVSAGSFITSVCQRSFSITVAQQSFTDLIDIPIVVSTLGVTALIGVVFYAVDPAYVCPLITAPYWPGRRFGRMYLTWFRLGRTGIWRRGAGCRVYC